MVNEQVREKKYIYFYMNKFLVGVLTKLDLVDRGAEQKLLEVFENKRIPLKLGYLMVKCRTQEDINNNIELSILIEIKFD